MLTGSHECQLLVGEAAQKLHYFCSELLQLQENIRLESGRTERLYRYRRVASRLVHHCDELLRMLGRSAA